MEFLNMRQVVAFLVSITCCSVLVRFSSGASELDTNADSMTDILFENREINKEIADGVIDHLLEEGDIYTNSVSEGRTKRTVTKRDGMKWPGAVIPYIIDTMFTDKERRFILASMQRFQDISCIKFRKRTIEPDYLFITPGRGCWSMVGRQGGRQKLSLVGTCKTRQGTVIHELMHCLGFRHEHNRPDRDSYIKILWQNIENGYLENFQRHTTSEVDTLGTTYDYYSIMHYPFTAFSERGDWTIQPLRQIDSYFAVGSKHDFSQLDIKKLNKLYNCGACQDTDFLYCPVWAMRGECTRNIAWMTEHCPFSCDRCPARAQMHALCHDNDNRCSRWADRGECRRNPSYMLSQCKRSCRECSLPDQHAEQEACTDYNTLCPEWVLLGECVHNAHFMQRNCKESCLLCVGGRGINRVCTDTDALCETWATGGLCRSHSQWMLPHCRKSCMVCQVTNRPPKVIRPPTQHLEQEETIEGRLGDTRAGEEPDRHSNVSVDYCTDLHSACSKWAQAKDCRTNAEWMTINCPKSCGLCGNSELLTAACVDRHANCTAWVRDGDCSQYRDWMASKCPLSCNMCQDNSRPQTKVKKGKCKDKQKKKCKAWAQTGDCKRYEHWMATNCQKSCEKCDIPTPACVDKEKKCAIWATEKECRRNEGFMLPNCQFSCNACDEEVPSCTDKKKTCKKYTKKGLCKTNRKKMSKDCPYSCQLCGEEEE